MYSYKLNHPLYPNPQIIALYNENNYPYRESTLDKLYNIKWYPKIRKKESELSHIVTQIFRLKVLNTDQEKILYDETITGLDHNENELDFYHRVGTWEKPIFRKQYDEETDEVVSVEIKRHETIYDIDYSADKILELAGLGPADTLSLNIMTGTRTYGGIGIFTLEEFAYLPFYALVEKGRTGRTDVPVEIPKVASRIEKQKEKPAKLEQS